MSGILGAFEQAVLLAVVKLGDNAYGRAILKETGIRLDRDVAAGAVYAILDRLESKGLLSSRLASGTPSRGGRARRYYKLEIAGVGALNETRATLEGLWRRRPGLDLRKLPCTMKRFCITPDPICELFGPLCWQSQVFLPFSI